MVLRVYRIYKRAGYKLKNMFSPFLLRLLKQAKQITNLKSQYQDYETSEDDADIIW